MMTPNYDSTSLAPPPPANEWLLTVKVLANKVFTVELPYGPTYGFEDVEEAIKFVSIIMKRAAQ